jgi:hypothetical protein
LAVASAAALNMAARAQDPVGEQFIVMIVDKEKSVILARGTVTPVFIRFEVKDPAALGSVGFGQKVYADLDEGQVSIDGTTLCCKIVQRREISAK